MMKFYFLLLFFISGQIICLAQSSVQDSIAWLIDSTEAETYEFQYASSQRALTLAKRAGLVEAQAKALIKIATSQSFIGEHVVSLENFAEAKLLIDENNLTALNERFYLKKAGVLVRTKNYEAALAHNQVAVEWFTAQKDTVNLGMTYGNLGAIHYLQSDFETAMTYYEKALETLENTDKKNDGGITVNLAGLYVSQDKPRKAIPIFETYLEEVRQKNSKIHEVSVLTNLGLAYGLIQDYQKSSEYYEAALELAEKENLVDAQYEALRLRSYTYETKGDYRNALETYRQYKQIQEEVVGKKTQKEIAELNLKYEASESEKELAINKEKVNRLEQEAKIKNQRYLLFLAAFLALGGLGVLLYFKRKADYEKNRRLQAAEQELMRTKLKNKELAEQQLQEKLSYQKKDLTNLTLDITRKNEFSDRLLAQIDDLERYVPKGAHSKLNTIKSFVVDNLRINEELSVFQKNIEEINQDFYSKLLQRFPGLTAKETELCGLIKLGRTNKEIAALKNISLNSAKMNRYRLRKKLGLAAEVDVVNFLREV